jgi:hypothetical protein
MDRFVEVAVKSAWWSKINWVSAVAMAATAATMFGFDFPPEMQAKVVATITGVSGFATIVLRTWFTTSVTPAVADKV